MDRGVAHVPTEKTRQDVRDFCCAGYTKDDIAKYLDICDDTLNKYYYVELRDAKMQMIRDIASTAVGMARSGDHKMIELVLKCQGRWSYAKPPEESTQQAAQASVMQKLIDKL